MAFSSIPSQIRTLTQPPPPNALASQIRAHVDAHFSDVAALIKPTYRDQTQPSSGLRKKRREGLDDEISHWEGKDTKAAKELQETSKALPSLLSNTQDSLQQLLQSAQELSLQRYNLADKLSELIGDISGSVEGQGTLDAEAKIRNKQRTILNELEGLQNDLGNLQAGLAWTNMLEEAVALSDSTLNPQNHKPSPLVALPHYRRLHALVEGMTKSLPKEMGLLHVVMDIKEQTWQGLKDIMSENLLIASEALGWPKQVVYENVPLEARRLFERAFQDLLYLQAEKESLEETGASRHPQWSLGTGLYPVQALVHPIELRFRYHFMGTKGTNRIDKPEWAFANILDQTYIHQTFLATYIQTLTSQAGYTSVSVKSEFTLLLLPILLSLLRARIPHLLDHPALLAHTVYQTVVFDEAVRGGGFDLKATSLYEGRDAPAWEGLVGVVLREDDWFERWLTGEKKFANARLQDIISANDAWVISEELPEEDEGLSNMRPTISSRQVKGLVEQIIDRYAPLPELEYKLPFLLTVQFPILATYQTRISGSLDAFETLSSAFVRAVPGALSGNTRSGINFDQRALTSGKIGVERLVKALLSSDWVGEAMRKWADGIFFVELSNDLHNSTALKWKIQSDPLVPQSIKAPTAADTSYQTASIFDVLIGQYEQLSRRAEDMIVKLVTVEVENELKQHLTRRWDNPPSAEPINPSAHFVSALTTYTSHISTLLSLLPSLTAARLYRRIVDELSRHILQRGVYSGWSKFSEKGGQDFREEINEWKEVTAQVFRSNRWNKDVWAIPYDAPWNKLVHVSKLLSLPTAPLPQSENDQEPTFSQAMAVAWTDSSNLVEFEERLGVEIGKEEMQRILRRRMECWR
ncbi:hypothetical protein CNBB3130 [Cryptococcus deneoformans B-3501A]|uniref:RAD50-interacting protein 1 n=1 Tax=Cryptococcus deneoformans (strain JEC21 / ATCC MYA-565) TaxID=214684 RepID=Q5KM88_CRYD1|nr:hypothetical protein CNB02550 [Cryptococcus neoformans var. neoformans JEC21]XP_777081.1 hypothetical protein CNBB3130 [Cryptococcus neoformans var. neoformans B-3501A]AAW41871.2 hypothetical protein CNB02550 [Cryptococcus neoformans var. neoformans JEC21]EAL22434.1 hypothetical protein CNBB3130 [Cryptococcus neoformans var. neoformans B-3501A]